MVTRIQTGVARTDLEASFPTYINEALNEIYRRRSWSFVKDEGQTTLTAGGTEINLTTTFTGFKELINSESPVHLKDNTALSSTVWVPININTKQRRLRQLQRFPGQLFEVYYHVDDGVHFLRMTETSTEDLTFLVDYYKIPADLSDDADEPEMMKRYPHMVLAKAKALAFLDINDQEADRQEGIYEKKFMEASGQDAYSALAGTRLHM